MRPPRIPIFLSNRPVSREISCTVGCERTRNAQIGPVSYGYNSVSQLADRDLHWGADFVCSQLHLPRTACPFRIGTGIRGRVSKPLFSQLCRVEHVSEAGGIRLLKPEYEVWP